MAHLEAAVEVAEEFGLIDGVQKNVINDHSVAGVLGSRVPGFKRRVLLSVDRTCIRQV